MSSQSQPGHTSTINSERQASFCPLSDSESENNSEIENETDPFESADNFDPNLSTPQTKILLEIQKNVKQINKKFDKLDQKK